MKRDVCPYCDSHTVVKSPHVGEGYDGRGYVCSACGRLLRYRRVSYYTAGEKTESRARRAELKRRYQERYRASHQGYFSDYYTRNRDHILLQQRLARKHNPTYPERHREWDRRYREKKRREHEEALEMAFDALSHNVYRPKERKMEPKQNEAHRPTRSTDLGALQGLMFEELDNLMSLDLSNGDPDAIEAEMKRAEAVSNIAGVAIDNANTVLRVVQQQSIAMGTDKKLPRMLTA